jgi:hypothetical protein
MARSDRQRIFFSLFWLLGALEGLAASGALIGAPTDPENIFAFGYSLNRLTLLGATVLLVIVLFAIAVAGWLTPTWREKILARIVPFKKILLVAGCFFFVASLALYGLPAYRLPAIYGYIERARPILIWLIALSAQLTLGVLFYNGLDWESFKNELRANRRTFLVQGALSAAFLLLWGLVAGTGVGIQPDRAFWNESGVPLLIEQIFFAWLGALIVAGLVAKLNNTPNIKLNRFIDIALFIALWGLAVWAWSSQPIVRSFFLPKPMAPNNEWFSFSDAASYDIGGQSILLGNGVNDGKFTDKPFYMLFTAITHAIGGQSYAGAIFVQTLILAFIPAMLYLLGKALHSRGLGILIGLLSIFKEINNIQATLKVQVSHSKLFLTEPLTALLLITFTWLVVRWFKNPSEKRLSLLLAGGVLGLAVLVRPNPLLIAPFVLLAALFAMQYQWRQWLYSACLFMLGLGLVISPWLISAQNEQGKSFLLAKINRVYARYAVSKVPVNATRAPKNTKTPAPGITATMTPENQTEIPGKNDKTTKAERKEKIASIKENSQARSIYEYTPQHFLHNEIASVVILPLTLQLDDIPHITGGPIWDVQWSGALTLENTILLALNLLIIAIGLGAAWARAKFAGLIPVIVNVAYFLANALARTSGSRYLIPADWTVYLYFGLGLIQITIWLAALIQTPLNGDEKQPAVAFPEKSNFKSLIGLSAILLLAGMSLPLAGVVIPQAYPPEKNDAALSALFIEADLSASPVTPDILTRLAGRKYARFFKAKIFYPRYFNPGEGFCRICTGTDRAFAQKDYPRLALLAIGSYTAAIELPLTESPQAIPNGSEIIVIGCLRGENSDLTMIDAIMIYIEQQNLLLVRSAEPELRCITNLPEITP